MKKLDDILESSLIKDYSVFRNKEGDGSFRYSVKKGKEQIGYASLDKSNKKMQLTVINPSYQRQGVGTALHKHIEKDLGYQLKPADEYSEAGKKFWNKFNTVRENRVIGFKAFLLEDRFNDILVKQRNKEGYHPALRDPVTKKVYTDGDIHAEIFKKMPPEAQENFKPYISDGRFEGSSHAGFVDKHGTWMSRYKVSSTLGNMNAGRASAESLLRHFHGE